MVEESADFVSRFRGQYVLELARLLLDFGFAIHGERIGEQPFGQPMTADNICGALQASWREFDDQRSVPDRDAGGLEGIVARIHEGFVIVGFGRMWPGGH